METGECPAAIKEAPSRVDYEKLEESTSVPDILMIQVDNAYQGDTDFVIMIQEADKAFQADILPELIKEGSSGSYMMKNPQSVSCHSSNMSSM